MSLVGLLVVTGCGAPGGWSSGTTEATSAQATDVPATDGGEPTPGNGFGSPADRGSRPDALESSLYGLVTADDRATYATERGLRYRDGRVEVVVELGKERELPDEFDAEVQSRHEHLVQTFVSVDELVSLSEHENVSYIRPPNRPATDESSTNSFHQ